MNSIAETMDLWAQIFKARRPVASSMAVNW